MSVALPSLISRDLSLARRTRISHWHVAVARHGVSDRRDELLLRVGVDVRVGNDLLVDDRRWLTVDINVVAFVYHSESLVERIFVESLDTSHLVLARVSRRHPLLALLFAGRRAPLLLTPPLRIDLWIDLARP